MRSRALDRLSRRSRESLLHQAAARLRGSIERPHADSERTLAMRQAYDRLDEHERDVLSLMYFWGLTAPEISAQLKVAEGTVRSRIARGLRILEGVLGDAIEREGGS
jgi:RNA polymerase sigma-70 factor (ECF subfamily)